MISAAGLGVPWVPDDVVVVGGDVTGGVTGAGVAGAGATGAGTRGSLSWGPASKLLTLSGTNLAPSGNFLAGGAGAGVVGLLTSGFFSLPPSLSKNMAPETPRPTPKRPRDMAP